MDLIVKESLREMRNFFSDYGNLLLSTMIFMWDCLRKVLLKSNLNLIATSKASLKYIEACVNSEGWRKNPIP